ncbi:hypothetical protein C0J52_07159 [Blattella germanica]|nr:hypothetical protein C0J52_07159 [Blattella germanica]
MAVDWRRLCVICGLVSLFFLVIPIKVDRKDDLKEQFKYFIKEFNKTYEDESPEYVKRFINFKKSIETVEELNKGIQNTVFGLTKYSDLSPEEFAQLHLQPKLAERIQTNKLRNVLHSKNYYNIEKRALQDDLPVHIDWREKKVITKVQNQKACGACWAFSTVETVESMYAIRNGILQTLSVQELIDCAGNGNLGCEGGDTCSLLEWLVDKKINIELESQYPLTWETQVCKLKGSEKGIQIAANYTCAHLVGSEDTILKLLAHHGPVAVSVNAVNWQYYLGGIIQYHCDGGIQHTNHAVQIVGYDRSPPIPHYIVRNSWGPEFGDKGYLYIAIGSNLCGLANEVSALDVL